MRGFYGCAHLTQREVAEELALRSMSFIAIGKGVGQIRSWTKAWNAFPIYVVQSLEKLTRLKTDGIMVILCDSRPALEETNAKIAPSDLTPSELIDWVMADEGKEVQLQVHPVTLKSVLEVATIHSILNDMQTRIYKITPYALRKEAQDHLISYFYGAKSEEWFKSFLDAYPAKLASIRELIEMPEAIALKEACEEAVPLEYDRDNVEAIAKRHKVQGFEITYIIKSFERKEREASK